MALNIITATFNGGTNATSNSAYQWDYGQVLKLEGIELPTAFECHFSNDPMLGETYTMVGTNNAVTIPDDVLRTGDTVYAWVFLHEGNADGETEYSVIIPIIARPEPSDLEPTPEQQDAIEQAIEALNDAVEATSESEANAKQSELNAKDSETNAKQSELNAKDSEINALEAEAKAKIYADNAKASEDNAKDSEENAAISADRAEQAATNAGYIDMEIDANGHLIYTKTDAVDVDFELINGHLIMEAV